MNTFVKGSVAAGAGLVLLLAGGGTFALWNQTASVSDTSVASGKLTLAATAGSWDTNPDLWVPTESYTYSTRLTVTATGTNLKAWLTLDDGSITGALDADPVVQARNDALADNLVVTLDVPTTSGITATTTPGTYEVQSRARSYTVPVHVTVTFPDVNGTTAQAGLVDLAGINFALQQHL